MNKQLLVIAHKLRNSLSEEDIKIIYENIRLKSEPQDGSIYIHWNSWWMFYLILFLLEMLQKEADDHFHFDDSNGMEPWSIELIFEKQVD